MKQLVVIIVLLALAAPACALSYQVPFTLDQKRELMIVELSINGRAGRFVVDPICAASVLSAEFSNVSAKTIPESALADRAALPKLQVILARMEFGGGKWQGLPFVVLSAEQLATSYKVPIDGVLGRDFLKRFRTVTIDFANKRLKVTE